MTDAEADLTENWQKYVDANEARIDAEAEAAAQMAHFCDGLSITFGPSGDAAAIVHERDARCKADLRAELAMMAK